MTKDGSDDTWVQELKAYVVHHPIVILKLEERELHGLKETRDEGRPGFVQNLRKSHLTR